MSKKPIVHLSAAGFQGHGCAFCGVGIPADAPDQFPLRIVLGGRATQLWVHRACMDRRVTESLRRTLEKLPPARVEDVLPERPSN